MVSGTFSFLISGLSGDKFQCIPKSIHTIPREGNRLGGLRLPNSPSSWIPESLSGAVSVLACRRAGECMPL